MLNVGEGVHAAVSQLETDPFSHPTNVKLPTTCTSKERSHPFPIQRGQCLGCHTLFVQETSADAGSEAPASSTASQPVVVLRAVREATRGFFASGFATLNIKEETLLDALACEALRKASERSAVLVATPIQNFRWLKRPGFNRIQLVSKKG